MLSLHWAVFFIISDWFLLNAGSLNEKDSLWGQIMSTLIDEPLQEPHIVELEIESIERAYVVVEDCGRQMTETFRLYRYVVDVSVTFMNWSLADLSWQNYPSSIAMLRSRSWHGQDLWVNKLACNVQASVCLTSWIMLQDSSLQKCYRFFSHTGLETFLLPMVRDWRADCEFVFVFCLAKSHVSPQKTWSCKWTMSSAAFHHTEQWPNCCYSRKFWHWCVNNQICFDWPFLFRNKLHGQELPAIVPSMIGRATKDCS